MKFKNLIKKSKETRKKYEYYLSLGYSDNAAKILSVVTYGDEDVAFLVKQLGRKNVIEKLYNWLHEREEKTPEEAIKEYYYEKYLRPLYEEEEKNRESFAKAQGSRPVPSGVCCDIPDPDEEDGILYHSSDAILGTDCEDVLYDEGPDVCREPVSPMVSAPRKE